MADFTVVSAYDALGETYVLFAFPGLIQPAAKAAFVLDGTNPQLDHVEAPTAELALRYVANGFEH